MGILSAPRSDHPWHVADAPCYYPSVGRWGAAQDRACLRMASFFHRFNGLALLFPLPALPGVVFHPIFHKSSLNQGLCSLRPSEVHRFRSRIKGLRGQAGKSAIHMLAWQMLTSSSIPSTIPLDMLGTGDRLMAGKLPPTLTPCDQLRRTSGAGRASGLASLRYLPSPGCC